MAYLSESENKKFGPMLSSTTEIVSGYQPDHRCDQNWAGHVAERCNDLTLRALFSEELGAVIQVRRDPGPGLTFRHSLENSLTHRFQD